MSVIWHYTTGDHLPSIIGEWTIRTASAAVRHGERPIVWFSTNAHWEQSARKGIYDACTGSTHTASMDEIHERANGLYRIGAPQTHPDADRRRTRAQGDGMGRESRRVARLVLSGPAE
jgi:hypothetical protein